MARYFVTVFILHFEHVFVRTPVLVILMIYLGERVVKHNHGARVSIQPSDTRVSLICSSQYPLLLVLTDEPWVTFLKALSWALELLFSLWHFYVQTSNKYQKHIKNTKCLKWLSSTHPVWLVTCLSPLFAKLISVCARLSSPFLSFPTWQDSHTAGRLILCPELWPHCTHPQTSQSLLISLLVVAHPYLFHSCSQETEVPILCPPAFSFPTHGHGAHQAFLSAGCCGHTGCFSPELGADSESKFPSYHQGRSQP